ncbi:MAG: T9SS type A sorting domain-containing protein [Ignavibacteria bacterium]|nr:T9SS type A sorting domain-containing protein [Ignavibacteria bacterium]
MFLADFLPGEGKLYKLAPVMQEGGTLVADEDCGGFEFECKGEVNNNGHDITIVPNTTIVFVNTSARINMNGGNFKSGIYPDESLPITLKSVGTATWKGLKLTGCDEVEMHQTYFENISSYPVDSTYAAEFTDCGSITVSNCTFQASSTSRTGSLLLSYSSQADPDDVYIFSNHFKLNTGSLPAVSVIATGYVGIPVLFEWNEFESSSENNTLAILLSNVTGGAIKENNFTGYDNTVMMLGSSVDFYGNYILGSEQSSKGIIQYSTSSANLSPSGGIFTGGYNTILVEGSLAACMQFSNSFLLIDQGYNIFRLAGSETGNWQLEGIILDEVYGNPYPAERNCFKIGNDLIVKHNLKYPDYATVVLDTLPGSCDPDEPEGLMVFDLGNGVSDTIHYLSGGSSSGAGKSNSKLKIRNYKYEEAAEAGSVSEAVAIRALSDSVSINLRKRDYERVSELCNELLTTHSDSVEDASLISKLYLAELKQDTSSSGMSELKSFLESYILNNPEREIMIRQAFYFVQKCKVSLGLYESAMSGFQQIINQFPYSYEGLLASWDYAATSLLNSQGGSGGGATSKNEPALKDEGVISYIDDPNDVYDSRKFSTDDRKTLNENLTKTFSSQVNKQTREIKSLEEKVTKNEASNSEKKRYQEMKVLKEVVKARKPETIAMHVSMISDDMSRIMKSTGGENSDKYEANILPTRFALHPNYPNPFNPATKISFDLPQDSRVSLVIYDLLGREVTRLVNNEFKVAGRYEYEFNASGLASGVYFYRLEARKFSETKRMALIK